MSRIDLHIVAVTVLGLALFGFGMESKPGLVGVLLVSQALLFVRCMERRHMSWGQIVANELFVLTGFIVAWSAL